MTEVPHETQEGCIRALHEEIARMRALLSTYIPPRYPNPTTYPRTGSTPKKNLRIPRASKP